MFNAVENLFNNRPDQNSGINTFSDFFGVLLNVAIAVGISVAVIALVYGGIMFVMSRGDVKATKTARYSVMYAILALIIAIMAISIRVIVLDILGAGGELTNEVPGF